MTVSAETVRDGTRAALWSSACFVLILIFAALIRLAGMDWLVGAGIREDFSFHPDENRFVEAAKSFRDYPTLHGYVLGMPTQLFVLLTTLQAVNFEPNALLTLRAITLVHALLMVGLTFLMAKQWTGSNAQALLASALMALCPLHIVSSNFGTADIAAVTLFYMAILAGAQYVRAGRDGWFTITAALCGLAIAVKFFIPLFAVLGLIIVTERGSARFEKALSGTLVFLGAFALGSFFNYTPWDFAALIRMILYDNVIIVGGNSTAKNAALYTWDLVPALTLPVSALALMGLIVWLKRHAPAAVRNAPSALRNVNVATLRSPAMLFTAPLLLHGLMILTAGVHSARHVLIYAPPLCILAAGTYFMIQRKLPLPRLAKAAITGLLFAYLAYNAFGLQMLYRTDVRLQMADWAQQKIREGHEVHAISFYTPVIGSHYDRNLDPLTLPQNAYLLTCDLEYERYLDSPNAEEIFHAKGGQARVDFYRDVFAGRSDFKIVATFDASPLTFEQELIDRGLLPGLDTFTPERCLALERELPPPNNLLPTSYPAVTS